jgi:hypothetical protein
MIQQKRGRPKIDAFAARQNKQVNRYWSRYPDPEAEAVNAFAQK